MAEEEPTGGEDTLQLLPVNLLIGEDAAVHHAPLGVYQPAALNGHIAPLTCGWGQPAADGLVCGLVWYRAEYSFSFTPKELTVATSSRHATMPKAHW